eukprot:5075038-Amphidinium_carterae.1
MSSSGRSWSLVKCGHQGSFVCTLPDACNYVKLCCTMMHLSSFSSATSQVPPATNTHDTMSPCHQGAYKGCMGAALFV